MLQDTKAHRNLIRRNPRLTLLLLLSLLRLRNLLIRTQIRPRLPLHPEPHSLVIVKEELVPLARIPHPSLLRHIEFRRIKQHIRRRHPHVLEEVHRDADARRVVGHDFPLQDLAFEGPEDDEAEVDVDVYDACPVADETLGRGEDVVETEAQAGLVDYFVAVFGVDVVFDCLRAALFEVLRADLDQVRYCDLFSCRLYEKIDRSFCFVFRIFFL